MADDKSGDGAEAPDGLKRVSGVQFRATEPKPAPINIDKELQELAKMRRAEIKEPAAGWSLGGVLGAGVLGGAAFAGGFAAGGHPMAHVQIMPSAADSVVNAVADCLASTSKLASPEMKEKAESLFRSALTETWGECESLAKDMSEDALKEVVKLGASALVLKTVLKPLLRRLKAAPFNPIVFEASEALQKIADKLGDEPGAKLDAQNASSWTEETPERAELLLRALKLHEVDGRWLLETNRPALDRALSTDRRG